MTDAASGFLEEILAALRPAAEIGGARVAFHGAGELPGYFAVTDFAAAAFGAAGWR